MIAHFVAKGLVIGLSIAAPVGPIGVLCIRRTLAEGRGVGLVTGLGAATADMLYGCVAGFGLTAISTFLIRERVLLGILGGGFLCYLGIQTFMARPPAEASSRRPSGGMISAYLSTLFLTLANPMTILSFVAIFSGFGIGVSSDFEETSWFVAGVFLGSALWWLLLSGSVSLLRDRLTLSGMRVVNRVSGAVVIVLGIYSIASAWSS